MFIDAIGKACPIPVVLAKKELDKGCTDFVIVVDNKTAVENVSRLAESRGLTAAVTERDGIYEMRIGKSAEGEGNLKSLYTAPAADCAPCGYAVFINKDTVGEGARELGENLLKMAIYTLSRSDNVPAAVLFMNSGVKLPAGEDQQVIDSLKELEEKGTEILVCGTCLSYYELTGQLKVGTVSNMYDILGKMQSAAKVVTL